MKTSLGRTVVVVATVLAGLVMSWGPAAATVYTTAISGGTLTLSRPPAAPTAISLAPTVGCPSDVVQVDVTPTTVNITQLTVQTVVSTGSYVAVITRTSSTTGTISGTAITGAGVSFSITLHHRLNPPCEAGQRVCGFTWTSTFSGTLTGVSTGNSYVVSAPAAGSALAPPCGVPFAAYIGGQVTITGLAFTI